MSNSFYKNERELIIKQFVTDMYNDYIGGLENSWVDGDKEFDYSSVTIDFLVEDFAQQLLKSKRGIPLDCGWVIEPKHIRFIGKDRIYEIVRHRVEFLYKKYGWLWERRK